jgi:hypothetical protein
VNTAPGQPGAPGELELALAYNRDQAAEQSPGYCRIRGGIILRADPEVWITPELLAILHEETSIVTDLTCAGPPGCPAGDLLLIHDMLGRRVLYQITGPAPAAVPLWTAKWPD